MSKLSALKTLEFKSIHGNASSPIPSACFPILNHFGMVDGSTGVLLAVSSTSSTCVKSLRISFTDGSGDLFALMSLASSRWSDTLTSFTLDWHIKFAHTPYSLLIATLEPLYSCQELKTLTIKGNVYFEPTDHDLDTIAQKLPNLESLEIEPRIIIGPIVSLHAVCWLTQTYLHLRRLTIPVDASATPPRLPRNQQHSKISALVWPQSIPGNPKHVTKFIRFLRLVCLPLALGPEGLRKWCRHGAVFLIPLLPSCPH